MKKFLWMLAAAVALAIALLIVINCIERKFDPPAPVVHTPKADIVVNPSKAQKKKADEVLTTKSRIVLPANFFRKSPRTGKRVEEGTKEGIPVEMPGAVQGQTKAPEAQPSEPVKVEVGKVVTTVTDKEGRVLGVTESPAMVEIDGDQVVVTTESQVAISFPDSPLKLAGFYNYETRVISPGLAFRICTIDVPWIKPDLDALANTNNEFGLGISKGVLKFERGSLYVGAGRVYSFNTGDGSWSIYIARSF